ncbi:MAG: hypothetical protein KJ548_12785 [Actinobacteria bacterium]|nr:hypothetical protein [Actinomycetota bacterium]MCG2799167.1 hypothetical protein [Cellulomonas sp.]
MHGRSFLTALLTCLALIVPVPLAASAAVPGRGERTAHIDAGPGPWSARSWLTGWSRHRAAAPTASPTVAPAPTAVATVAPTAAPVSAPAAGQGTGITISVTIPEVFTLAVLEQVQTADRCEVLVAVTDTRSSHPGFVVSVSGGGHGTLVAEQVPGNGMSADDLQVGRTWAAYPTGLGIGSVRLRGTFDTCPSWSLL